MKEQSTVFCHLFSKKMIEADNFELFLTDRKKLWRWIDFSERRVILVDCETNTQSTRATIPNLICFNAVNGFCLHDKYTRGTFFSASTTENCAIKFIIRFLHRDIILNNEVGASFFFLFRRLYWTSNWSHITITSGRFSLLQIGGDKSDKTNCEICLEKINAKYWRRKRRTFQTFSSVH